MRGHGLPLAASIAEGRQKRRHAAALKMSGGGLPLALLRVKLARNGLFIAERFPSVPVALKSRSRSDDTLVIEVDGSACTDRKRAHQLTM
jgi:hypothetical protein